MADVELTIHEPGHKTRVHSSELPQLRGQGLIRAGDDGEELVTPVDEPPAGSPAPATPAGKPPAAPAAKTASPAGAAASKEN